MAIAWAHKGAPPRTQVYLLEHAIPSEEEWAETCSGSVAVDGALHVDWAEFASPYVDDSHVVQHRVARDRTRKPLPRLEFPAHTPVSPQWWDLGFDAKPITQTWAIDAHLRDVSVLNCAGVDLRRLIPAVKFYLEAEFGPMSFVR